MAVGLSVYRLFHKEFQSILNRRLYIDSTPFHISTQVDQLMNEVETLYTTELESGDRTRAMQRLRIPPLEEKQPSSCHFFRRECLWLVNIRSNSCSDLCNRSTKSFDLSKISRNRNIFNGYLVNQCQSILLIILLGFLSIYPTIRFRYISDCLLNQSATDILPKRSIMVCEKIISRLFGTVSSGRIC